MTLKIKFGISTLLALALATNFALAQASKQTGKPIVQRTSAEYQTLKKDWDNFQTKAEAKAGNQAEKPGLEKEYNGLLDRLENLCEGTKVPVPVKVVPLGMQTTDKPKKEQVSAMK